MFGLEFSSHSQRSEMREEKQMIYMCLRYWNATANEGRLLGKMLLSQKTMCFNFNLKEKKKTFIFTVIHLADNFFI